MKIITLHVDYIKFKPVKKALKSAELTKEEEKEKEVKEALVILTAVEKSDSLSIVKDYIENIKDIASQIKAKNIVIYPYAHLSPNLANPDLALQILKKSEEELKKDRNFNVIRAPFGYYKEFELKCKGHPLAELSRSINPASGTEEKAEEKELAENDRKVLLNQISKSKLDTSKLKENDHRILGQRLDLFSFNDVAPGMVFWHNNGLIIYNELIKFWKEEHEKAGYEEILTPQILDSKLWKISGHWEKYKENMFFTEYEKREFAVKPMNCPGGILVYKSKPRSYKELPLKMAELGTVHRKELSGVLGGLFRVVKLTQDDAHIYCREKQLEEEIASIIELISKIYKKFNFSYHVELSTKPEKRISSDSLWEKAEEILEKVLKKKKINFMIKKGEGAFYGPKIDFHIKDSQERSWQCATIQLDFAMPERFELEYADENNKKQQPVMIHRTVLGSIERFIGILLEHLNGNLPYWLSPVQVRVLSFTDRNIKASEKILAELKDSGIRADSDLNSTTINSKVRDAELQKIPYVIVIGDKEEKHKTLAIRNRAGKVKHNAKLEGFISQIKKEIEERR